MQKRYRASVIIPTYNKINYLKLTLFSLLQSGELEDIQVIVVNDGSGDGTAEYLEKYKKNVNFTILDVKNGGRSSARNKGAKMASSDILIFMDDDILIEKGFIKNHIACHQRDHRVVHGMIKEIPFLKAFSNPSLPVTVDGKEHSKLERFLINEETIANDFGRIRHMGRIGKFENDILQLCGQEKYAKYHWVSTIGANFSIQKNTFFQIGGFDMRLGKGWGCEDLEFGYRGRQNKVDFMINKQALVYHMSHFRENGMLMHQEAMKYFWTKHKSEELFILNEYFEGAVANLIEWAERCGERSSIIGLYKTFARNN